MDKNLFSCSVCFQAWSQKKQPKILPNCGHTICECCLNKLLNSPEPRCPLDFGNLEQQYNYQTNYFAEEFIEVKTANGVCQEHGERYINICLTHKCKICNECFLNAHRDHEIKTIKELKLEAANKVNELEKAKEEFRKDYKELREYLYERKEKDRDFIKDSFLAIRELISVKENTLLEKVSLSYHERIDNLEENLEKYAAWYTTTTNKILQLSSDIESEDFFNLEGLNKFGDYDYYHSFCKDQISFEEKKQKKTFLKELNKIQELIEQTNFNYLDVENNFNDVQDNNSQNMIPFKEDQIEVDSSLDIEILDLDIIITQQKRKKRVVFNSKNFERLYFSQKY